ncbi:MAG: lamin tail domain-containing protein [Planctomycetota bacterium]
MTTTLLRTALIGAALSVAATAQARLNEVSYDADGADEGMVFVEIIGLGASTDVSGWQIVGYELGTATTSGMVQGAMVDEFTFPMGTILLGGELLVVADGDVDGGVTMVPNADFVDGDMDLENGADAVVLIDAMGNVVDALGYGAPDAAAPALAVDGPAAGQVYFEGSTVTDFFGPLSVQRCPDGVDTDDNSVDFHPGTPTPGELNGLFCSALEVNNVTGGGPFNVASLALGTQLGFNTYTSFAGPNMVRGGLPQLLLLSLTDPNVVAPGPLFPIPLDAATPALIDAANTGIFPNFFIVSLPENNTTGDQIMFDAGQLIPPITGLPITFYAGTVVFGGPTGFIPSTNFVEFILDV